MLTNAHERTETLEAMLQAIDALPRLSTEDLKGRAIVIHSGGDNYSDVPKKLGGGGSSPARHDARRCKVRAPKPADGCGGGSPAAIAAAASAPVM